MAAFVEGEEAMTEEGTNISLVNFGVSIAAFGHLGFEIYLHDRQNACNADNLRRTWQELVVIISVVGHALLAGHCRHGKASSSWRLL